MSQQPPPQAATQVQATPARRGARRSWWANFKGDLNRKTEPSVFIKLIILDKVFRAVLGIALGIGLFSLLRTMAPIAFLEHLASEISLSKVGPAIEMQLEKLANLKHGTLIALAIGACAYAALELVEGIGLWLRRRWAEYLTLLATLIPIPFIEIPELAARFTWVRLSALVINIAIVIYLIIARKLFRFVPQPAEAIASPAGE
jgi:uncharacterized membrane protein (DUF2068 family)